MGRCISLVYAIVVCTAVSFATAVAQPVTSSLSVPLHLVENRGQWPDAVCFSADGLDRSIRFRRGGVTVWLRNAGATSAVDVEFVDAAKVAPVGERKRPATFSYFTGADPAQWTRGATSFESVRYPSLWPGIDLVYDGTRAGLKYRFEVAPGADPARIRLRYTGQRAMRVDEQGRLIVETRAGSLVDPEPVSFQKHRRVATRYRLQSNDTHADVTFTLAAYDRSKPLIVDPVVFVYCGYIAGTNRTLNGIAVDPAGNLYAAGSALTTTLPTRVGPRPAPAGMRGAFVAKVDPTGRTLLYAGYLSSTANDACNAVAVDASGAAYVTGSTGPGFPHKGPGPYANYGAFVAKIKPDGTDLDYSVVLGGPTWAVGLGRAIALDASGSAFVAGDTEHDEQVFPVRVGPDLTHNGVGGPDAFVAKLDNGGRIVYCGYVGGRSHDNVAAAAVDPNGRFVVLGSTTNDEQTFPVKVGPDLTHNGGGFPLPLDAWICRVNAAGTTLDYCGYIGGDSADLPMGVAVDAAGRAYVAGSTYSSAATFPTVVGPRLTRSGPSDAFLARVSATGDRLETCGFIGGSMWDDAAGIAIDRNGAVYLAGFTDAPSLPATEGPQLRYQGRGDGFVAKVRPDATGLVFIGYFGGDESDGIGDLALGADGGLFVAGLTRSSEKSFPLLVGPDLSWNYPPVRPSSREREGFVAKLAITLLEYDVMPRPGETVSFWLTASNDVGKRYQLGSSLAAGAIPIDTRILGLAIDPLLALSVSGLAPSVFSDYAGTIGTGPAAGRATGRLTIPAMGSLVGVDIFSAFVTLDSNAPSGVAGISNVVKVTVR